MNELNLANTIAIIQQSTDHLRHWQIRDAAHPDLGAIYNREWGCGEPKITGKFMVSCGYLALAHALPDEDLLVQADLAANYLLRSRRPGGLIDLISVNIDSGPDTAFTVQELCTVLELARQQKIDHPTWSSFLTKIDVFVRESVSAMASGGFHTPNHRWVIVAALTQAHRLFPELDIKDAVENYLAEGIDLDEEGMFIERSIGVYDAVNDRSLLLIHENWQCAGALPAVQQNLATDLQMLHADGTAETGLSRRQDYGTRQVALGLVPYLLWSNHFTANPQFVEAAQWLWQQAHRDSKTPITDHDAHLHWLTYVLMKYGEGLEGRGQEPLQNRAHQQEESAHRLGVPDNFVCHYPHNGFHRVRRGLLSATFFRDTTRLLTITHGEAELSSLKISQTYFGQYIGRFVSDSMDFADNKLVLRSAGRANPRRPAYELPLGRPVPPDQWSASMNQRALRWLPHAVNQLTVSEVAQGFDLHLQTLAGAEQVALQIALDFPPGGIWESADTRCSTHAGQVIFLKQGWGAMRFGSDQIEISPGHIAHGMWQMRDAETAPDHVRLLLTFFTPVDFTLHIRARKWTIDDRS